MALSDLRISKASVQVTVRACPSSASPEFHARADKIATRHSVFCSPWLQILSLRVAGDS